MGKILLTGMTSAHVSRSANEKTKSFMGVLADVLTSEGHEVTWHRASPIDSREIYDAYDSVVVGITPLGSLAANYAYGALNVLDRMWGSDKLTILVDAPNASQIEPNLRLLQSNPQTFIKPFFSARSGYKDLLGSPEDVARLLSVVDRLLSSDWPSTVFPRLPWRLETEIKLPPNAKKNLSGINLDSYLISDGSEIPESRSEKWVVDTPKSKWATSIVKTLALPAVSMKINRAATDNEVQEQIKRSAGALVAPDSREGTWWTYRLIQCLNGGVPIATDWQEAQRLGTPWAMLAASIESLGGQQRHLLALAQKEIYTANIDSKDIAKQRLEQILRIG